MDHHPHQMPDHGLAGHPPTAHDPTGHGHGGGGMDHMCSMNMLFTWDTTNLCIVFRQWHVRSTASLLFSLVAVVLLAMLYEALRALSRRFEASQHRRIAAMPNDDEPAETTPFLPSGQVHHQASQRAQVIKALFYALQNFYAFMLMLIFMTYNGWVMLAVSFGAFLGYLLFGQTTSATKDNACH